MGEVGGVKETVLSRERGATVTSELLLGGTPRGRGPLSFLSLLPFSVSVSVSKCLRFGAPFHGCSS